MSALSSGWPCINEPYLMAGYDDKIWVESPPKAKLSIQGWFDAQYSAALLEIQQFKKVELFLTVIIYSHCRIIHRVEQPLNVHDA